LILDAGRVNAYRTGKTREKRPRCSGVHGPVISPRRWSHRVGLASRRWPQLDDRQGQLVHGGSGGDEPAAAGGRTCPGCQGCAGRVFAPDAGSGPERVGVARSSARYARPLVQRSSGWCEPD